MRTNVGTVDRVIRIVLGLVLIGLAVSGIIGAWGWVGLIPLLTGVVSICPLYSALGIKTCPPPEQKAG